MRCSIQLNLGDCMDAMRKMPDNAFELAVCDPPYFSGPEKRAFYGRNEGIMKRVNYKPLENSWKVPGEEYFKELQRVSKKWIIWGCNYYSFAGNAPGRIIWDKVNASSSFSDCECAMTNLFDTVRLFRYMWNGMLQGKSVSEGHIQIGDKRKNEKRIHPTQKPVLLYKWLLQNYAKEGDKILDTHLGSGSIALACWDMKFDLTGYELDEVYYKAACERLKKHQAQGQMF